MYKFKLAEISKDLHEGRVQTIHVQVGALVHEGDPLFVVQSDKGTSNVIAPVGGKIKAMFIKVGALVHGATEVLHIAKVVPTQASSPPQVVTTQGQATSQEATKQQGTWEGKKITTSDAPGTTFTNVTQRVLTGKRVLATPYSRKLAAEKKIDISDVPGTGYNGRVLAKDILAFIDEPMTRPSTSRLAPLKPFAKPVSAMRHAIAKAMTNSWNNVAYTNLATEVNMTKLWEERKSLVAYTEKQYGIKISFTALIALAVIKVLPDFPELNSKYHAHEHVLKHPGVINLGIAVDTTKGLIVPVVQHAHMKDIVGMAQAIIELAAKARAGKLTKEDMIGGTFTLTNYGSVGAMFGVPVINYPEIAILGVGAIVDRVFGHANGDVYNGKVMYLSLAADHRWVDGADIGRFIFRLKELLEHPILLLGGI